MSSRDSVAVIGGTGFVGQQLVQALLHKGLRVRVVSRNATPSTTPALTCVRGDVGSPLSMRPALEGVGVVYNLATGGGDRWQDFERDVLQGGLELARISRELGIRRLIYTSSIAALHLGTRAVVDGRTPPDPRDGKRSFYSRAKIKAEHALLQFHKETGFPIVIVRPGVVVGAGGSLNHGGLGIWSSDTWCVGWDRGEHGIPFVLVRDVAAALVCAAEVDGIDGMVLNLVGDVRISAAEFVQLLAQRSLRNYHFCPQSVPKLFGLEVIKWLIKAAARKSENRFPSYHDLKSRSLRAPFDCSAEKRLLHWTPTADREEFLRQAIDVHLPEIPRGDLRVA